MHTTIHPLIADFEERQSLAQAHQPRFVQPPCADLQQLVQDGLLTAVMSQSSQSGSLRLRE